MKSVTLLLVDDQETVLRVFEYIFTLRGYRVLLAESGEAALGIMRTESIQAALVDVHMPRMDGFQTVEALLAIAHERRVQLPVWLMTGAFTPAAAKRARQVGAVTLLSKPFDNAAFLADLAKKLEEAKPVAGSR